MFYKHKDVISQRHYKPNCITETHRVLELKAPLISPSTHFTDK